MQIGIDARLNAYRRGGIPQYTRQLMTALAALSPADTFVSLQHPDHLRPLVVAPNVQRRTIYTPPHHRLEQVTLPVELLPLRLSLLHTPDFIPPLRRSLPAVTTIHDLAFLRYPEILDDAARRYYGQVRQAVQSAEGVIAVSEATRTDIADLLSIDPGHVEVIYEAAAPAFQPQELAAYEERVINGETLRAGGFALFVSTIEPRKNLPLLLHALRACLDRDPSSSMRLVIVGARGWRYEPILDTLATLRLGNAVLLLDSVSTSDLVWLYNACRLFALPSIYEGFGLPLLEAMACGAACLASNISSLPEIAGDGALLLPPDDAQIWADSLQMLWKDDAQRVALGARAIARAHEFSWQQAARQTLALYRRVAQAGRQRNGAMVIAPAGAKATPHAAPAEEIFEQPDGLEAPGALLDEAEEQPHDPATLPLVQADGGQPQTRTCLRCEGTLSPAELAHALTIRQGEQTRVPRLWLCTTCGYAELVVEPQHHVAPQSVEATQATGGQVQHPSLPASQHPE